MRQYINPRAVSVNINHLYGIIKNFRDAFPDNFEQTGLTICTQCEGSGLPIKPNNKCITFWQGDEFCDGCKGFGIIGIEKIYDEYLCKECKGSGCAYCEDKGTVDWIRNAVKRK